jgi:hypothetical protein
MRIGFIGLALVGKAGVDRHRYLDLLTSTLFSAPIAAQDAGQEKR